ncbi:Up-regulated during septation-domain-containing protein [Mortierella sp. GBAus27b]|nr:Up-regulated during septation-domain-containing protein [Mortierella sp. GBAus27b]
MNTHGARERSNSDRYRATSPNPDRTGMHGRRPSIGNLARSHSNGGGSLQSRQQYEQVQYQLQQESMERSQHVGNGYDQDTNQLMRHDSNGSSFPKRKASGGNLLRMARQASDTALRGMGLSRKPSDKNKDLDQRPAQGSHDQNSHVWAQHGVRSQSPLHHRGPYLDPTHNGSQQSQDHVCPRTHETELARNKSMPDIKHAAQNQKAPERVSSLRRQRSQHRPQHQKVPKDIIQDAYGGTTDDWRQAMQAEKEARERQLQEDSGSMERLGHTSINSVSTLNLPPTTAAPTTSSLGRSTSRMLLPDRDRQRNQSAVGQMPGAHGVQDEDPEPTQENTSLAKAAAQHGGILSQLQAATEAGRVIDPVATFWSHNDGRYIQRSNTAPYSTRENRTIMEEDELSPRPGGGSNLEYSKSEGHAAAALRNNRPKRGPPQQQVDPISPLSDQFYYGVQLEDHPQQQEDVFTQSQHPNQNEPPPHPHHPTNYQAFNDQPPHHHQAQFQQQQHHQQQRAISRARAMSNESAVDTNKDLPPTPKRTTEASHTQRQPRLRSDSHPDSRHRRQGSSGLQTMTSEESVLALSRSMSPPPPPPQKHSHQRSGSFGQLARAMTNTQQGSVPSHPPNMPRERVQYGIDMLPLPIIPSPDESLKRNENLGILPQDILRTLDSETIQKIVTQAVIASRVYKALTLEEVESLKKEQEDLQKYIDTLTVSLAIETRMRDASHSLIRLHETNTNIEAVKASTGQLHATTRKMDQIVHKIQQSMERQVKIQRLLLQHEGAVLNAGMRRLDGENRELSRTIAELETVRDQEKEEKLKWKKEHTQLRIQSMIFPNPPGMEDFSALMANGAPQNSSSSQFLALPVDPTPPQSPLQQDTHLAALEDYMKELNDDISMKDERIGELESQLRMIKVWADEFAGTLRPKFGDISGEYIERTSEDSSATCQMQKQLTRLQARIEEGFRALEANAHEQKVKAEEAEIAKNKALEFAATTLTNTSAVSGYSGRTASSNPNVGDSDAHRSRSRQHDPSRLRGPYNRSKSSLNDMHTAHHNNSDLNMVLNESLLELDHQISLESSRQTLSRENSLSGGSVQRRPSRTKPRTGHYQQQPRDEYAIEDANEEIKRLNAMVDELERLVRLKMQ